MKREDDWVVETLRQRLVGLYLLKYALASLTVWAFLYGTAVLALRGALRLPREELMWGLASLPLALGPAIYLVWRRLPPVRALRALIDQHSRCGGLLMAEDQHSLAEWQSSLPELRQPTIRWRGRSALALFAGGLAFVALGFLVPDVLADLIVPRLDVNREVDQLTRQVDVLKEEKVLGRERAEALSAKLEQVRREASGKDPAKTLESLDHVQEVASKAARDAAEAAVRKAEMMGRAETMAEALDKLASKMDPAQLTEAMQMLAVMARKAATEQELLEMGLDEETMEALKKGTLTPEQMKKLADALKSGKMALDRKLGRLMKVKLLDASDLEKLDKAGKCDCEGLVAFLKENGAKSDLSDAIAKSGKPGKGGTDRGPAPAKLTFGDETTEDGFKFKEEELPPAALQAMKDSQLSGLSAGQPNIGKEKAKTGASGALAGAKAGGGSANTQVVLPRHRGAVERYFERPAKKN